MSTGREIMSQSAECVGENDTIARAAQKLRDLEVGDLVVLISS